MKEIFAAFSAEIFRPLITLLIPGFWALSPGVIALLVLDSRVWQFVQLHSTASSLCFLAVSVALGMILENLGGEIENRFFRLYPESAVADWYRYLALTLVPEPVAYSYIRSYVQRLKFEGGMCTASPLALLGSLALPLPWYLKAGWCLIVALLGLYFFFQVRSSVAELVDVRQQLLHFLSPAPTPPGPQLPPLTARPLWSREA